jgi:serine/threonine-protein kinase
VARLLDFGVAKAAVRQQTTEQGQLKGKLAYMAPEQVRLQPIDRRSDLFAASIVFWEMLTGARLFDTGEPAATVAKIVEASVPPPSSLAPGISPELDAVVLRGLARDPGHRFGTALEMAKALDRAAVASTTRSVGELVERAARATLSRRAARVAEVESDSATGGAPFVGGAPTMKVVGSDASEAPTDVSASLAYDPAHEVASGETRPHSRPRYRIARWFLGASLVAVVSFSLTVSLSRRRMATGQEGAAMASGTEVPPSGDPGIRQAEGTAAPASQPSGGAALDVVSAAVARPPGAAPRETTAASSARATPTTPKARVTRCQPNFYVDDRGIKRFKPECLELR